MAYLFWKEKKIKKTSARQAEELYEKGFVFTRKGKGVLQQTRSARINLAKFSPNSENRRILKKNREVSLWEKAIPVPNYDWRIGKTAKDFYETKFGEKVMSANKMKEMLTDVKKTNFNTLLEYKKNVYEFPIGFCIAFETEKITHYSYPFYNRISAPKDIGLGMMTLAILRAKEKKKKYFYLGSLQRPTDTYKAQFDGFEWFDGKKWQKNIKKLKEILQK